jgi:hypothetical protein
MWLCLRRRSTGGDNTDGPEQHSDPEANSPHRAKQQWHGEPYSPYRRVGLPGFCRFFDPAIGRVQDFLELRAGLLLARKQRKMPFYFAYGSNMRHARLEERIDTVQRGRRATLLDHVHSFSKLGADGTGKGTIAPAPGERVEGIVYRTSEAQLDELCKYEPGYRQVVVDVLTCDGVVSAVTFEALELHRGLRPMPWYIEHYLAGMMEHPFPAEYVRAILADAGAAAAAA